MNCIVNDVLKQIKESEESAIEKQRTLQSLDVKIEEGEKKSIQLDQELVRAKNELKQTENDEIFHVVHLQEIETRLKCLNIQSSNIDKQIFEELKVGRDKMKTVGDSATKIVQEVNMFVGTYGPNPDDEQRDKLQEKWSLLLREKLVKCKHQFEKFREIESQIGKINADEHRFEKLQAELVKVIKTKELQELESAELMTDISHLTIERSRTQADPKVMSEIQNLQDQILSLQSENDKAISSEHQRTLLNAQFGKSGWSDQGMNNKKWDQQNQEVSFEADETGDNSNREQFLLDNGPTDLSVSGFVSARHCISGLDRQENFARSLKSNINKIQSDLKEDMEDVFNLTEVSDMDFQAENITEKWEDF